MTKGFFTRRILLAVFTEPSARIALSLSHIYQFNEVDFACIIQQQNVENILPTYFAFGEADRSPRC